MELDAVIRAHWAIEQVLVRYCRGVDRMDADLTLSCWHEDATLDYSPAFLGSPKEFVEWLWPIHGRMLGHVHALSNVTVSLYDETTAGSESYVNAYLRLREADGTVVDSVGRSRYVDEWERRAGDWRMTSRRLVLEFRNNHPIVPYDRAAHAPANVSGLTEHPSRRDRSDISYDVLRPRR
jgi:SnoaL-like protein